MLVERNQFEWIGPLMLVQDRQQGRRGRRRGAGQLDLDPLFVDETGGDLRLSEDSPLIDQGIDEVPFDPPFFARSGGAD